MRTISVGSSDESFQVSGCTLFKVPSVASYSYTPGSWTIHTNDSSSSNTWCLIIDTFYDDAFGHWVYESAIYLPIFLQLKTIYPSIKLVLKRNRTYKSLFLRYFGIDESDVVYQVPPGATCLIPEPISSLNTQDLTDQYKNLVHEFYTWFDSRVSPNIDVDYVILPRQRMENYPGNDRRYDFSRVIEALKDRSRLIETDSITELGVQIDLIRSGNSVLVTDGSPFLVNGMFCKDRTIYIIDANITAGQRVLYPKKEFIIQIIESRNRVISINQTAFLETLNRA